MDSSSNKENLSENYNIIKEEDDKLNINKEFNINNNKEEKKDIKDKYDEIAKNVTKDIMNLGFNNNELKYDFNEKKK